MNSKSETINNRSLVVDIIGWFLGIILLAIGSINIFWGNDFWFGVFIALLSFAFFPPANILFRKLFGISIPVATKIAIALLILWASLGVGELFEKIEL